MAGERARDPNSPRARRSVRPSACARCRALSVARRRRSDGSVKKDYRSREPKFDYAQSGKMLVLMDLLQLVKRTSNERFVLISNFTSTLDLFEKMVRPLWRRPTHARRRHPRPRTTRLRHEPHC